MRIKKRKAFVFFLAAAMLIANISALTFASADVATKTAAEDDSTRAAAPTASIKAGTYKDTQKVSLATSTKEAVIYYTTDGKAPTNKSTKFDSKKPIEIEKTTTVKAIAVKAGLKDSPVASFTYTISATAEATVTPTATAAATVTPAAEATIAPAAEPTATAAPTVKPADEPAPADETMKLTVDYEGTISVDETTVTELMAAANLTNYKPKGEKGETEVPYEVKSVTWSQSTADTTPTPTATPETAGKITAGEEYTVKITLGVKDGATTGTSAPEVTEVTFLGATLKENSDGSNIFEGKVEVPDLKITPTPASGGEAEAGSAVTLAPSVTGATLTYSIDGGKTYQNYSSSGVPVSGTAGGTLTVNVRGEIAPFAYPEQTFTYSVTDAKPDPIRYVDIYGLTHRGYNKKPLTKDDIEVASDDGEVVLKSVT